MPPVFYRLGLIANVPCIVVSVFFAYCL